MAVSPAAVATPVGTLSRAAIGKASRVILEDGMVERIDGTSRAYCTGGLDVGRVSLW